VRIGGQAAVGVDEDQDIAHRGRGPGVQLPSTAPVSLDHARSERMPDGHAGGVVGGRAVGDDDLGAARQGGQVVEHPRKRPSLVKCGNDDRDECLGW